ncbi:ABC transporter ATP-binding protein [Anaerorhabdus sp.]|uniref:ABC transporter ATP-binding protein n=1 Tax=Anaerorhabdus sp. TaxID=1872524 RepID=UPI002FC8BE31
MEEILRVENLSVNIHKGKEVFNAVNQLSFSIGHSQVLGLVGESGCGKSITNLAIMKLLAPNVKSTGDIWFNEKRISEMDDKQFNDLRGNEIAMIFQDSISGLNPLIKVGHQVEEVFTKRKKMSKEVAKEKVLELFEKVRIPNPQMTYNKYPHELSGGQRQRVMISLAIACKPKLLIADEPTTALDVTTQQQILNLLLDLKEEMQMSIIIISHDLNVIRKMCDNILVMYAGKVVEKGRCIEVLSKPRHPYTLSLMKSIPSIASKGKLLECIAGTVPSVEDRPKDNQCLFADRCNRKCMNYQDVSVYTNISETHQILCQRKGDLYD